MIESRNYGNIKQIIELKSLKVLQYSFVIANQLYINRLFAQNWVILQHYDTTFKCSSLL